MQGLFGLCMGRKALPHGAAGLDSILKDLVHDCTAAYVGRLKGLLSSAMFCVPFLLAGNLCLLLNCCDLQPSFSMQTACDSTFTAVSQLALLKGQWLL